MKADLLALIRTDAGVATVAGARVWWAERPQGSALPAAILHVISGGDDYHLRGRIALTETRVQVDCWGDRYLAVDALARAVRERLSGYLGTVGTTRFAGIFLDGDRDMTDQAGAADAGGGKAMPRLFRVSLDFIVHHHSTGA